MEKSCQLPAAAVVAAERKKKSSDDDVSYLVHVSRSVIGDQLLITTHSK